MRIAAWIYSSVGTNTVGRSRLVEAAGGAMRGAQFHHGHSRIHPALHCPSRGIHQLGRTGGSAQTSATSAATAEPTRPASESNRCCSIVGIISIRRQQRRTSRQQNQGTILAHTNSHALPIAHHSSVLVAHPQLLAQSVDGHHFGHHAAVGGMAVIANAHLGRPPHRNGIAHRVAIGNPRFHAGHTFIVPTVSGNIMSLGGIGAAANFNHRRYLAWHTGWQRFLHHIGVHDIHVDNDGDVVVLDDLFAVVGNVFVGYSICEWCMLCVD
mmetsp:Transcript_5403/g.15857  ORF Transcript_5403/g.15857 Transcript_5403/m.15857 type:complete len:268 (+) Transcript_5403:138-941(+)